METTLSVTNRVTAIEVVLVSVVIVENVSCIEFIGEDNCCMGLAAKIITSL